MTAKELQQDHRRLLNNLKLLQTQYSATTLSEIIGVSRATWFNRMKEPWRSFCYDDFKAISRHCKIDVIQIIDGELKIK